MDFINFLLIALLVLSGVWIIYLFKLLNNTKREFSKKNHYIEDKLNIFSKAINQSPSVAVITDLNGSIEYVNPQFTKITGYTQEETVGCNPRILKSGDKSTEVYKQLWKTRIFLKRILDFVKGHFTQINHKGVRFEFSPRKYNFRWICRVYYPFSVLQAC